MDLNNLSIFVSVIDTGSLTAAAGRLGMPKSKVSRRLAQFEQQQGAPLLLRSTRKMHMTELGRELYERSRPLLEELRAIEQTVLDSQYQAVGTIAIQIPVDFFPNQMTDLCAEFLQQYPQVRLSINHYLGHYPQELDNEDCAFVLHQGPLPDSSYHARPLLSRRQYLYAASHLYKEDYLLSHELSAQPCLMDPAEDAWLFKEGRSLQAVRVHGPLMVSNQRMLVEACIAGLGIAKLVESDVEAQVRVGALVRLKTHLGLEAQSLSILYRNQYLARRVRLFIDFFQSNIGRLSSRLL